MMEDSNQSVILDAGKDAESFQRMIYARMFIYLMVLIFGVIWFMVSLQGLFAVGDGGTQAAITAGTWNAKIQADREVAEAEAEVNESIAELNRQIDAILADPSIN